MRMKMFRITAVTLTTLSVGVLLSGCWLHGFPTLH
jgi:hypothetical protein